MKGGRVAAHICFEVYSIMYGVDQRHWIRYAKAPKDITDGNISQKLARRRLGRNDLQLPSPLRELDPYTPDYNHCDIETRSRCKFHSYLEIMGVPKPQLSGQTSARLAPVALRAIKTKFERRSIAPVISRGFYGNTAERRAIST